MSQRKMSQKNGHSMLRYEVRIAYTSELFMLYESWKHEW